MLGAGQPRRILAALDGSSQSEAAVQYLADYFPPQALAPVLLHVSTRLPDSLWDWANDPVIKCHPTKLALSECPAPLDQSGPVSGINQPTEPVAPYPAERSADESGWPDFIRQARLMLIKRGVPETAIKVIIKEKNLGIARDILAESVNGYEALMVGCTGTGSLKGLVLGGTAFKLLGRMTDLPLCLVAGKPASDNILAAVDASPACARAIEFVASLGATNRNRILLFHAIKCPNLPVGAPELPTVLPDADLIQRAASSIEPIIESHVRKLVEAGFEAKRVEVRVVSGVQSRARAIVTAASDGGYGTIVMGRRGLSKVEEFLLGRVTNKVIHLAANTAVWVIT